MNTVKDTNGNVWQVLEVITKGKARRAQIYPGFGQINITREGTGHHGIQLPEWMIEQWVKGEIRVPMTNGTQS